MKSAIRVSATFVFMRLSKTGSESAYLLYMGNLCATIEKAPSQLLPKFYDSQQRLTCGYECPSRNKINTCKMYPQSNRKPMN